MGFLAEQCKTKKEDFSDSTVYEALERFSDEMRVNDSIPDQYGRIGTVYARIARPLFDATINRPILIP